MTQEETDALAAGDLGLAVAAPQASSRRSWRPPAPSSRPAATSSTARPRRRSRPRSTADVLRGAQRRPAARARGLHRPSEAGQAARAPARDGRARRRHRLGAGRGARVRLAADRGHAGAPDRPGLRARHVLPAPPRAARRQDRPARSRRSRACRARKAPMELHNSPLSEIACLGFEYGYSMEAPETLVLWEAQFGDFVNSAQVIIDQFIVSALSKWGQTTRLTLLLPHGYEGSGPEHSSARLERFLILAAEGNIRVANLTTPAQYFHLLRRQARVAKQRPLVIMTPKSLLRLPQATSRIEHLSESRFFPVLSEPRIDEEKVTRLVLCTGKIYYDLKGHATRENNEGVAISRVELLYPFPQQQILDEVARYPNLREVVWVQEEPRNMGARAHMSPRLLHILPSHARVRLRRPARARLAGRGLPGRPHGRADPHHPHRARPLDAGVGQPGQAAGRAVAGAVAVRAAARAGARSAGRAVRGPPRRRARSPARGGRAACPSRVHLDRRAADGVDAGVEVAGVGEREAGPEQQLVGLRRELGGAAVERAGLGRRVRRPAARRPRPASSYARWRPSRRRSSPSGSAWSSTRRSTRALPRPRPRRARRAARRTGARGRRRPRPRPPRAPPSAARRGRRSARSKAADIAAGTVSRGHHVGLAASSARRRRRRRTGMQSGAGVDGRRRPSASTTPTWRTARQRVGGEQRGERVARRSRRPPSGRARAARGAGSTTDWVATAPTPGRAQMHSEPTENQCDCTAAPSSPVAGSRATIE